MGIISKLIYLSLRSPHLQLIPIISIWRPLNGFEPDLFESINVDRSGIVRNSFLILFFLVVVLGKHSLILLLLFVISFHFLVIFQALDYVLFFFVSQILWAIIWVIHWLVLIWKFLIDDMQLHLLSKYILRLFSLFYCFLHCMNLVAEIRWIKCGCALKCKLRLFDQMFRIR